MANQPFIKPTRQYGIGSSSTANPRSDGVGGGTLRFGLDLSLRPVGASSASSSDNSSGMQLLPRRADRAAETVRVPPGGGGEGPVPAGEGDPGGREQRPAGRCAGDGE